MEFYSAVRMLVFIAEHLGLWLIERFTHLQQEQNVVSRFDNFDSNSSNKLIFEKYLKKNY